MFNDGRKYPGFVNENFRQMAKRGRGNDRDQSFRCWKNSRNFQVEVEFLPVRFYNFEIIPDSESEICTVGCDESDRSKPRRENPRQKEKHYTQYTQSVIVDVDIWNILTNIEHI